MKTIDKIPITKISRATKLVSTGAKVGVNYLKYYGDKMTKSKTDAKERLNQNNAEDIYDSLKTLNICATFSALPLVIKTFKKYFGKHPDELFDTFNATSVNAASIGQVHLAEKDGKKFAVKIQYPGVAESIASESFPLMLNILMAMGFTKAKL